MTEQQKQHAAEVLLNTKQLTGGDEPKYLPKLYVVNGKCYMFLNVARRAAYGTDHSIEVMTIEDAWQIYLHLSADSLNRDHVEWDFDQTGSTFEGLLFRDNKHIYANSVLNPVVKMTSGKPDLSVVMSQDINLMFLSGRAQNILTKTGCKTYADLIKFTRSSLFKLRNVGVTTISEFDAEMDRVGLSRNWQYNKPII